MVFGFGDFLGIFIIGMGLHNFVSVCVCAGEYVLGGGGGGCGWMGGS